MKIKEEQLKKIQDQQGKVSKILNEVGYLEAQKHALAHEFGDMNTKVEDFKKELEEEYGKVNINLTDGSYTEIEEELENV